MHEKHHTINYLELPMRDSESTKTFYSTVFGWTFTDWGAEYIAFSGAGIDGGFTMMPVSSPGVLVVLYSDEPSATQAAIVAAGGQITRARFNFPGGSRFHFQDPNGNELAVWSEQTV